MGILALSRRVSGACSLSPWALVQLQVQPVARISAWISLPSFQSLKCPSHGTIETWPQAQWPLASLQSQPERQSLLEKTGSAGTQWAWT